MDAEEIVDLRQQLLRQIADIPERRIMVLGVHLESLLRMPSESPARSIEIGLAALAFLHTGMRHPEWMQAVVKDSMDTMKETGEETYERMIKEVIGYYPLPEAIRD